MNGLRLYSNLEFSKHLQFDVFCSLMSVSLMTHAIKKDSPVISMDSLEQSIVSSDVTALQSGFTCGGRS